MSSRLKTAPKSPKKASRRPNDGFQDAWKDPKTAHDNPKTTPQYSQDSPRDAPKTIPLNRIYCSGSRYLAMAPGSMVGYRQFIGMTLEDYWNVGRLFACYWEFIGRLLGAHWHNAWRLLTGYWKLFADYWEEHQLDSIRFRFEIILKLYFQGLRVSKRTRLKYKFISLG